ncbi:TetR/AcrR family transcriptional regulator [Amycolatopsis sp. SID8362]|uniref:TetR/AcrR family transcriptional regulator n=1 Tax=Amycolatopsis sp. SID8362 TaxID=2690346 RepID=UPI00136EE86C|nr:TetR/AcrR family transcriptional regulator [Amycolatopsis sp. SID8362]NBH03936.1 TetR family transcriptional regulator [Amycolatopsis sp. SID8362]NED40636.1 TetR/AcrR family transcriptional regulator [Amycolatopsis sp. SID8362]
MRTVDPAKHAAKRRAIVDAAAGCFAGKGFERTTTADICRAAGISSGSLFHYFPSKRAVFTAIFTDDAVETAERLEAAAKAEDPWAALLDVVAELAGQLAHPAVVRLVLEAAAQAARDDEFAELIHRNDSALRDGLAVLVERAEAAGLIDPGIAPRAAAGWVTGLLDAMISRAGLDPDLDLAAEQAILRTILIRFLRPVSPPAGS